jgi:hypothetical protein
MPNEVIVSDPLGKTICFLPEILFSQNGKEEIYDDATTVIKKAALVEVQENKTIQRYYFRSIGNNKTLLITVRQNVDRWEAHSCIKNPSREICSRF